MIPIMMSCHNSSQSIISEDEQEDVVITTPPAPDIFILRKNIREYGDSMSLEKYQMYYCEYQSMDNDSLLFYAKIMAEKYSYNRAYYAMFNYWVYKYNEKKWRTGVSDASLVDSAMDCLYEGAQRGVKSCNILLSDLYANGIYFERDTTLSNDCLKKAGYTCVTDIRKISEEYYRRKNLEIFMKDHGRCRQEYDMYGVTAPTGKSPDENNK